VRCGVIWWVDHHGITCPIMKGNDGTPIPMNRRQSGKPGQRPFSHRRFSILGYGRRACLVLYSSSMLMYLEGSHVFYPLVIIIFPHRKEGLGQRWQERQINTRSCIIILVELKLGVLRCRECTVKPAPAGLLPCGYRSSYMFYCYHSLGQSHYGTG
jgi:hypothetical protein